MRLASSSCYISDNGDYAFSAGGPSARIHTITEDGGLGELVDELFYVPEEEMDNVGKTREAVVSFLSVLPLIILVCLVSYMAVPNKTLYTIHSVSSTTNPFPKLYGAHAFDLNVNNKAFVPHL